MTFGQFISILQARWKLALAVVLTIVTTAAVISLLLPKQYTASASVVLDISPDPLSAAGFGGMASPAYMATQIDILQSDRVARRVVGMLKLAENTDLRGKWMQATEGRGDLEAWVATSLRQGLDVKPARESNVINVAFQAPDASFAATTANAFVKAYIDTVLDLRVDPAKRYTNFFDTRSKELREQLEAAQAKLSEYQRRKGLIATEERFDFETSRLAELSGQIMAAQSIAAESTGRQTAAQGRSADQLQDVLTNPVVAALKADLARGEARLQELNSRLGDAHPQVVEAKANNASLRSRLESEIRRVTSGVGVTNTINRQREGEFRAAYEAQRQKVLRMKEQRDEAAVYQREVENAQRAYDSVLNRYNQTSLESQTTQTNIGVLTPAVEPSWPSSPKLALNVALAAFVGALLGIGLVVSLEMMNRRVRSIDDVVQTLGLPVLGVLSGPDRGARSQTQSLLARQVLGQLPMSASKKA
ncbi:chain length determinant protein EpsF [Methylibium sp.]|uniref:chain length determinant protein EpsF n=1 Tax=Methylibium sp. TaxID=2067992 RepID=UPI003D0DEA64